jgi:hypothetical protein
MNRENKLNIITCDDWIIASEFVTKKHSLLVWGLKFILKEANGIETYNGWVAEVVCTWLVELSGLSKFIKIYSQYITNDTYFFNFFKW